MDELKSLKCMACSKGAPQVADDQIKILMQQIPEWMKNPPKITSQHNNKQKDPKMPDWMKNPPEMKNRKTQNRNNSIKKDMPQWMKNPSKIIKQHQENKDLPEWMRKK